MPCTIPKTRNCMAGSSKLSQVTSHGRKRKHQALSDAFDDSDTVERYTDDKGRTIAKKVRLNEAKKGVNGDYQSRSLEDLNTRALVGTSTQTEPSSSRSLTKRYRLRSSTNISDEDETQDKKIQTELQIEKIPKIHPSQSFKKPHRGILRNAAKLEPSKSLLFTSHAILDTHRILPDLFWGDLEKHAAQDKVLLASLKSQGFPVDTIGPIPEFLLQFLTIEVVVTAEDDDADVPLKSTMTEIRGALRDEQFKQVVYHGYWKRSFRDLRNHPLLRISKVRFLEPVVGKLY